MARFLFSERVTIVELCACLRVNEGRFLGEGFIRLRLHDLFWPFMPRSLPGAADVDVSSK